ncbi:hypothetical protein QZH41_010680, partial [Actinostola sp. cb2023]
LTNIALQRSDWLRAQYRANIILYAPEMLIFVDETGCDKRLQGRYGYSFQGSQALIRRDFIRSPRISAIAAIGLDGPRAIKTFHESVNAEKFVKFLEYELLPILQPYNGINPDSVVIMDNACIHHVRRVRRLITQTGARLIFLPPYSPDLNPIEEAFSKVKRMDS